MKKQIVTNLQELKKKSELVECIDANVLIDLEDTFIGLRGYGLASPQIGIFKKIAIVRTPTLILNLVNPRIIEKERKIVFEEGCLSFPGLVIKTDRYLDIVFENLEYIPEIERYEYKRYAVEGLDAIVIQHEIDHLNGLTIFDRKHKAK